MRPKVYDPQAASEVQRQALVTRFLTGYAARHNEALRDAMRRLRRLANRLGEPCVLCGRIKTTTSVSNKVLKTNCDPDLVLDILGIRIITTCTVDCYQLHAMIRLEFDELKGQFNDFIAHPKTNGYRSIHTTIIGLHGLPVEIQIRTRWMHAIAEIGPARLEREASSYESA